MRKIKFYLLALIGLMAVMTSCGDDEPGGGSVTKAGQNRKLVSIKITSIDNFDPSTYGLDMHIFGDAIYSNGKLTSYSSLFHGGDKDTYKLTYNGNSVVVDDGWHDVDYCALNSQGFVTEFAIMSNMTYNSDGQLVSYDDVDEGSYTMTYVEGDLTKIVNTKPSNKTYTRKLTYTNDVVTTPIENKGGIMFYEFWGILSSYEAWYWSGLVGNASKHLPVKCDEDTIEWTLDDKGYPSKCVYHDDYYGTYTLVFTWE